MSQFVYNIQVDDRHMMECGFVEAKSIKQAEERVKGMFPNHEFIGCYLPVKRNNKGKAPENENKTIRELCEEHEADTTMLLRIIDRLDREDRRLVRDRHYAIRLLEQVWSQVARETLEWVYEEWRKVRL